MHKVILDSNIIISAVVFGGKPLKVLSLAVLGCIDAYVSSHIKAEVLDKLTNKFHEDLRFTLELFDVIKIIKDVDVDKYVGSIRDPKDDFLLALADKVSADYIITGDKDLLVLKKYKECRILTAKDFLNIIEY